MKIEIASARYQKLNSKWNSDRFTPDERLIPWNRLYLPVRGKGLVRSARGEYPLYPGLMVLIPAYAMVHVSCSEYMEKYWSHFNLYSDGIRDDHFSLCHEPMTYSMKVGEFDFFYRLFQRLCDSFKEFGGSPAGIDSTVQQASAALLLEPFLKNTMETQQIENSPQIIKLVTIMQRHKFCRLSVERLGEEAGMAPHQVFRIFREKMNCAPLFYMKQQRLRRACIMLAHTLSMTISEIAEECGYETVAAFSKAFHLQYGMGPREYRNELSKAPRRGWHSSPL